MFSYCLRFVAWPTAVHSRQVAGLDSILGKNWVYQVICRSLLPILLQEIEQVDVVRTLSWKMFATWLLTVLALIPSWDAISLLVCPDPMVG